MAKKIKIAPGMYITVSNIHRNGAAPHTAMVTARLHVKWWSWPVLFWQTAVKEQYPLWVWPYVLWLIARYSVSAWFNGPRPYGGGDGDI